MYPDYISVKQMKKNYEGNIITPMGCRAFLPAYQDNNGNYKVDGRFNLGVTTINLPQIAILSKGDKQLFYNILDERLQLAREMGMVRYNLLKNVTSDVSPIHWQYGAIARLDKGEKIGKLFKNKYATVTVGYIGMYEVSKLMTGKSNTSPEGEKFTYDVLQYMKNTLDEWYKENNIYFALYGTPSESTAGRLCSIDTEKFGKIKDVTDKGYYINSFHVDVREEIDAFSKLDFEAKYQNVSTGGCISYVEIPNLTNNTEAILTVIKHMYDHITYAEFNTKSDNCHVCKYEGEIMNNENGEWYCPQCGNKDQSRMTVVRRTCGLNN